MPLWLIWFGDLYLYLWFSALQYGRYLNVYKKYDDLLDNTAEQNISEFLKENHEIEDFVMVGDATWHFFYILVTCYRQSNSTVLAGDEARGKCIEAKDKLNYWICSFLQRINSIKKRRNEIASMHITVPLAMFCLDTMTLNYDLCERAQNLKDRLIQFQVDVNRDTNTRYYCCMQGNSSDNWHKRENEKGDCTFQQWPGWTSNSTCFCPQSEGCRDSRFRRDDKQ